MHTQTLIASFQEEHKTESKFVANQLSPSLELNRRSDVDSSLMTVVYLIRPRQLQDSVGL